MTSAPPVTSGHDPATAPRIAVAGAFPLEATDRAENVIKFKPSGTAPSVAGNLPAADIPVSAAGSPYDDAYEDYRRGSQAIVHPGCRTGVLKFVAITTMFLVAFTALSYAQSETVALPPMKVEGKAEPRIGGQKSNTCVAVDIAGHKAGDADCAAQKLQDAAKEAQDRAKDQPIPNIPSATSPDTQIGVANEAATKQRLGDSFGKSVLPQRPPSPPVAPSPFARQ